MTRRREHAPAQETRAVRRGTTRHARVPAPLGRSVAAVVFDWDGTAVPDRSADAVAVRTRVEQLSANGTHVAVVSGTHLANVDGQLGARPSGPGRLLLALNRGSELFEVSARGPALLSRRTETAEAGRCLDLVAARVMTVLDERGLEVALVSQRLNRRKIDLIPEAAWSDPPKARIGELVRAVTARLQDSGFASIQDVVQLAVRIAGECGLADARVSSDAKHVEIGLTDKSDSMRSVLDQCWRSGVGPGLVLVVGDEFGPIGGVPGSDSRMLVDRALTAVSVGAEPDGLPDGVCRLGGGPETFLRLLDEQLHRSVVMRVPSIDLDPDWVLRETGTNVSRHRVTETLFTLSAGGFATRGSVEEGDPAGHPLVLAAGVYAGDGAADGLLPGPNWLATRIDPAPVRDVRTLDLRTGVLHREEVRSDGPPLRSARFASLTVPGVMAMRLEAGAGRVAALSDARVDQAAEPGTWTVVRGHAGGGIGALVVDAAGRDGSVETVQRLVGLVATSSRAPRRSTAEARLATARSKGFDALLAAQRAAWADRWAAVDVRVPGHRDVERALRFALFQLWSVTGRGRELAVGARGLTGSGYLGHVFWDADVFVLPALVTLDPAAARAMVQYRLDRLDRACRRARSEGRKGARFPWESGLTGEDVTPSEGFLGAHRVPVLTGPHEEHVTADVAWATVHRATWGSESGRLSPAEGRLLAETARYWAARCQVDSAGRSHIEEVIGPDEYHEHVDDNTYTNVMARWNLRTAARRQECPVSRTERRRWLEVADSIVDGYDASTGRYEQFRGYFGLEPLLVRDFASPPVAADVLAGPERIAGSQVIKQPDVLMLHHLVPDEVAPGSLEANLDFYAPRTAHGSSLSPAIMASLLFRAGRSADASALLDVALGMDLEDTGGMTSAGVHLANCGGVWQAVLFGVVGAEVRGGVLHLDPRLPEDWPALDLRFRCMGSDVQLHVDRTRVEVASSRRVRVRLQSGPEVVAGRRKTELRGGVSP